MMGTLRFGVFAYLPILALVQDFGYKPQMPLREGMKLFVDWFRRYYMGAK